MRQVIIFLVLVSALPLLGEQSLDITVDYGTDMDLDGELRDRIKGSTRFRASTIDAGMDRRYNPSDIPSGTGYFCHGSGNGINIVAGNFNLTLGSGLVAGNAGYSLKGPFNAVSPPGRGLRVTPDRSGLGEASLQGLWIQKVWNGSLAKSMSLWYSHRYRYYDVEKDLADISLSTLDGKLWKDQLFDDRVTRHDGGLSFSVTRGNGYLEGSAVVSMLSSRDGLVMWDNDPVNDVNRARLWYNGYSLYGVYRGKIFSVYGEAALSLQGRSTGELIVAPAFQAGLTARNSKARFSLCARYRDQRWYAPLSNLAREPDSWLEARLGFRPMGLFMISLGAWLQYRPGIFTERLGADAGIGIKTRFGLNSELKAKVIMDREGGEQALSWQGKGIIAWDSRGWLSADVSGTVQQSGGLSSWELGLRITARLGKALYMGLLYGYTCAVEGNGIYSMVLPMEGRGFNTYYSSEPVHRVSLKIRIKLQGFHVSSRYGLAIAGQRCEHGFDCSAGVHLE